jgi:hypothetical protein
MSFDVFWPKKLPSPLFPFLTAKTGNACRGQVGAWATQAATAILVPAQMVGGEKPRLA